MRYLMTMSCLSVISLFCILISLSACGKIEPQQKKPAPNMIEQLRDRYEANLAKLGNDWPSRTDCDGTLFAGLAKAGGSKLDISESQSKTGQWFRRPSKDCHSTSSSRSEFSNDMALGIILSASTGQLKHWFNWVRANNYRMGEGDPGATILKPNVRGVLIRRLGGDAIRLPYAPNTKDYVRHIQMLMIYVDGRTTGFVKQSEINMLKSYNNGQDYLLMSILAKYGQESMANVYRTLLAEPTAPSYVRGDSPERYRLAHWLFAAKVALDE